MHRWPDLSKKRGKEKTKGGGVLTGDGVKEKGRVLRNVYVQRRKGVGTSKRGSEERGQELGTCCFFRTSDRGGGLRWVSRKN